MQELRDKMGTWATAFRGSTLLGKVAGKLPPQFHYDCWMLADEVSSFVKFEGPLQLMGPIVRIELVNPQLLAKPEDEKISSQ